MKKGNIKQLQKARRQKRIRAKISGTADMPRFSVHRSNKFVYAQLIDDTKSTTLVAHSSMDSKAKTPKERAREVGVEIAKKALAKGITKVVFDRSGYIYAGKIREIADGAREAGLKF